MSMEAVKQYEPLFGSWHVVEQIGEGAFGEVYLVEREDFGVKYQSALKFIRIPASKGEVQSVLDYGMTAEGVTTYFQGIVEDMVKEIGLMSRMKGHSNVVSYEDHICVPHEDGLGWDILIRMELLTPLQRYVKAHPLTEMDVVKLGVDICRALELCEKNGIIHRDVKPGNIMVSDNGDFKLGDFGIARTIEKSVGAMSRKGTYSYMAPEVYRGEEYGNTADLYSLGVVMYQMLNNNRTPFMPPYPQAIRPDDEENARFRRLKGESLPEPMNGMPALKQIVCRACAYAPADRYATAAEMRRALEALLGRGAAQPVMAGAAVQTGGGESAETILTDVEPGEATPNLRLTPEPAADLSEMRSEDSYLFQAPTELLDERTELLSDKTEVLSEKTEILRENSASAPPQTPRVQPAVQKKKSKVPLIVGIAAVAVVVLLAVVLLSAGGGKQPQPTPESPSVPNVPTQEPVPQDDGTFSLGDMSFSAEDTRIEARDAGLTDADLQVLERETACTNLILTGNAISDLSFLDWQPQMKSLYLSDNQISDLSPICSLSELEVLSLVNNSISDLTPLATRTGDWASNSDLFATKLSYLELSHNQITEVSPLGCQVNLTYLALDNNQIEDVTPLMTLDKLETLLLGGNPISREQIVALREALPNCEIKVYYELAESLALVELSDLAAGREYAIQVETEPAGPGNQVNAGKLEAVWSVSDESIAEIKQTEEGPVLQAKKPGTVTVTVELDGLTAEQEITVVKGASGISISPTYKQLTAGSAFTISINTTHSSASFSSSNPGVATVDGSGTVVAKTAGSATIYVTTDVGSASCSVHVIW